MPEFPAGALVSFCWWLNSGTGHSRGPGLGPGHFVDRRGVRPSRPGCAGERSLLIRGPALRRSLARPADKSPLSPRYGDSFFLPERSKDRTRLRRRAEVFLRGIRAAELSPPDDSRSEQRPPRTHRLQTILIQRTPTGFCRLDEPVNYFPRGPAGKEIYPGNAGAR